ncbi:methylated-DNA--[protein]-cysteine S-methyltransferase [Asticcacaulis sp. ZE23SCel15]|uniref:methylated-DNA--[protein]-cysteine S-methyltransferase n=1 Tax=Asticcacaulis sp. ZE23SCel15 TaxID=3059027 RepID=UPI00266039BF|nr:methylated-DNA--[protein]-cysteine S-methyltransferase [Asticcacaulis sp. ZE23SCel15]WKL58816.1 methylated-DNA--[protein]-cysteine S-methyltransferase [Asticcacaulis sp. ZE23SCel15]
MPKSSPPAETIHYATGPSSLGSVLVAQSTAGLCSLMIDDDPKALRDQLALRFPDAELIEDVPGLRSVLAQAIALIDAPDAAYDGPLDLRGTAFQQSVWQALMTVPAGQTLTYSELAQRVGNPKAVRAVAAACGANRIAVVIPCHRIIGRKGSLTGYRWGVKRKQALLQREERGHGHA